MKKIISGIIVFFILLSTTFAYNSTSKDEAILNKVYSKIDKVNLVTTKKLYNQISKLKSKYESKPQIYYLLSELENYLKIKINGSELYEVLSVSDGDTIKIDYKGEKTKIRFIGIDTPESFITRFGYKECYGDEASNYLKELLTGKKVSIEFDTTQDRIDKYGRLLAYVILDGENISAKLIKEGYAFEYTYEKVYKYQKDFKAYEKKSKELDKGLWNENTCNGERKEVIEDNSSNIDSSVFKGNVLKYYDPTNLNYLNIGFTCEKPKYCTQMISCEEATFYWKKCGAIGFDRDKDLIPCENLCGIEIK